MSTSFDSTSGIPPRWIKYIYEKYGIYTVLNHSVGRYGMTIDGDLGQPGRLLRGALSVAREGADGGAGSAIQRHAWLLDVAARQREQLRTLLEVQRDRGFAGGGSG